MLKLKGRYAFDLMMEKNHSALIVPKAVTAFIIDKHKIEDYIYQSKDMFDFMIRAKVQRANKLVMRWDDPINFDESQQHLSRFYITNHGGRLINIKPQKHEIGEYKRANKLTNDYFNEVMNEIGKGVWDERIHTKNKSIYEPDTETGICTGYLSTICNNVSDFRWSEVNYDWYINQAKKLIIT